MQRKNRRVKNNLFSNSETIYSDTLKINDKYAEYIAGTLEYKYNWLIGAFRSGKSTFNVLAMAIALENSNDSIHLVLASTVSLARQIYEDGNGKLGLKQYFCGRYTSGKYKENTAGFIQTKTGTKVILYLGGAKSTSFTSFRGMSLGCIAMEEIDLLHENTITEVRGRILAAEDPKVFITMNPNNPKLPVYQWLRELQAKDMVNFQRTCIDDNPAMSDKRKQEIKEEFPKDSLFYKRYILGEDITTGEIIYHLQDFNIFKTTINPDDYIDYVTVCDPGVTISSSAFILAALKYDRVQNKYVMDILKTEDYKNSGKNDVNVKMYSDTAKDYGNFILACRDIMQKYPSKMFIDIDPEFYRNIKIEFGKLRLNWAEVKYAIKDKIEERVKLGVNLLWKGKLRFYEPACEKMICEFKNSQIDLKEMEKSGKFVRLKEYNEEGHSDYIDCVDYAMSYYKHRLYES